MMGPQSSAPLSLVPVSLVKLADEPSLLDDDPEVQSVRTAWKRRLVTNSEQANLARRLERHIWEVRPGRIPTLEGHATYMPELRSIVFVPDTGQAADAIRAFAAIGQKWVRVTRCGDVWFDPALTRTVEAELELRNWVTYTDLPVPAQMPLKPQRDAYWSYRYHFVISNALPKTQILDVGSNLGEYSRAFIRRGRHVVRYELDPRHSELAGLLDGYFRLPNVPDHGDFLRESIANSREPKTVLLLSVLRHWSQPSDRRKAAEVLSHASIAQIIAETGSSPQEELRFLCSLGFQLRAAEPSFGTGLFRQLIDLRRDGHRD